jgi:hypothetical protein
MKLPANIAAAIDDLVREIDTHGAVCVDDVIGARAALVAAILARLAAAAEDDAEATCRAIRDEEVAYWQDAARIAEAQRDTLRGKLDEMHACLRLAEGSCATLRAERDAALARAERLEAENARLRTACEQYEKGAAEVHSGFPGAAMAHFEEARAALSPAAE